MINKSDHRLIISILITLALGLLIPSGLTWGADAYQTVPTAGSSPTPTSTSTSTPTATLTRSPTFAPTSTTSTNIPSTRTPSPSPLPPPETEITGTSTLVATSTPEGTASPVSNTPAFTVTSTSAGDSAPSGTPVEEGYPPPQQSENLMEYPAPAEVEQTTSVYPIPPESSGQTPASLIVLFVGGILVILSGLIWFHLRRRSRTSYDSQ